MKTVAFFSYSRFDDDSLNGVLVRLHMEIKNALIRISGDRNLEIFLDQDAIEYGQYWERRIDNALGEAFFLIPIISPTFLTSSNCRNEFSKFLEHEKEILPDRNSNEDGLIFPISFVEDWKVKRFEKDEIVQIVQEVKRRQYINLENVRHVKTASGMDTINKIEDLARRMVKMLEAWPDQNPQIADVGSKQSSLALKQNTDVNEIAASFSKLSSSLLSQTVAPGHWISRPEDSKIAQFIADKTGQTLCLLGSPGSGKTALLAKVANDVVTQGHATLAIKADLRHPLIINNLVL